MSEKTIWGLWVKTRNLLEDYGPCVVSLLTRITIGEVFLTSGWGKLQDISKVIEFFTELGIPLPAFQAHLASYTEFICGGLVLVGAFTRLSSIPLMITMIVAILTAKRGDLHSFDDLTGFIEYLYIVLLAWLVVKGPGVVSLDYWVGKRFEKQS